MTPQGINAAIVLAVAEFFKNAHSEKWEFKAKKGDKGDIGPIGPKGHTGPQGVASKDGKAGKPGVNGLVGPRGPQGVKGDKGDKGDSASFDGEKFRQDFIDDLSGRLNFWGGAGSSGGAAISLKTNGAVNGSQAILNLVAGANVTLTDNGSGNVTISSLANPVINASTGLFGGSSTGALGISATAVTPASYGTSSAISQFTVNQHGQITAASSIPVTFNQGTVTNVSTGTGLTGGPITSTGTVSINSTGVAAATYGSLSTFAQLTVNAQGQLTSASSVAFSTAPLNASTGLFGGASTGAIGLANTAVGTGTYGSSSTLTQFTVNAQGQLTAASSIAFSSTPLNASTGLFGGTSTGAIGLANTAVATGTYGSASTHVQATVNQQGQLTAISSLALPTATSFTNSLASDVALSTTANYFDGPSVAQGTTAAQTWLAMGTVTVTDTSTAANIIAKLWDGTTVMASAVMETSLIGGDFVALALSGIITSPVGNIRMSVRDSSSGAGVMKANATGNAKDSTVTAIRIA